MKKLILLVLLAQCTSKPRIEVPKNMCIMVNSHGQYRVRDSLGRILGRGLSLESANALVWTFVDPSFKYTFADSNEAKQAIVEYLYYSDTSFHCIR